MRYAMKTERWIALRRWALAAALPLLAACGASAEAGALPEGPPAGEVVALDDDAEGQRLLKAYPHALYRSGDGGATWEPIPVPASVQEGEIAAIATPADAPGTLYIAGPGLGVMRSEDEGETWVAIDEELPSRDVRAFAAHVDQPQTLYAFLGEEGVFRSEDAGESWTRMDGGPGVPVGKVFHSGMEGSMQSGWLFAATPEGVRRSMDCFCGWRPTGELPGGEVFDVAYDPRTPEHVYAATAAGLFRSVNGGEAWEPVSGTIQATALAIDPRSGALYAAADGGALLRSTDQGRTWESVGA
jgi:photosystem II stability/assembly factor-like uncharacterized protein